MKVKELSASERLRNICAALEEDLNESPFTREEWDRLDAERLELLKANDALAARLAEAQEELAQWRATGESVTRNEYVLSARLAEVQDKLSIALAANHDLRDERDSLKDRLADPCKTYDKDGRLLTVCHRLAEVEALRKDAERWRHEWQRECADTDLLLQGMGLCPSEYRSEGGSLLLGRISHKLKQRGGLS